MNKLAQLVREIVDAHLGEDKKYTGSPRLGIKILDKEKADKVKKLYAGHYIADMIQAIEDSGEQGTTQNDLANALDIKYQYLVSDLKALSDNGVIGRGRPEKAPKPEKTGQRGRKVSDKSRAGIIRTLFQNFKDNADYEPSEEDITYNLPKGLGTEKLSSQDVTKIKNSALGTTKRGRPAKPKEDELGGLKAAMKESLTLSEQFLRMHKLAGLS